MMNKLSLFVGIFLVLFSCEQRKAIFKHHDFESALLDARNRNTKVLVVFDNFGSPTKYVDALLADPEIFKSLNRFVVAQLMCDEKSMLNDSISKGAYNANLQISKTGQFYQPMFCFFDNQGNSIGPHLSYSTKAELLAYFEKEQF